MAITKPVELFWVDRKDLKATFHEQLDDGTPWDFDGDRDPVHLPCGQGRQPRSALGQSDSLMRDAAFTDTVAVTVQDTDLVGLRAPINPDKPLVGDSMIRGLMVTMGMNRYYPYFLSSLFLAPRGPYSALYWRSRRDFLRDVHHGNLARVHVQVRHCACRA